MEIGIFLVIVALAIIMEFIDAGFGMGYGTVLTPLLLIFGFEVLLIVPSVLFSQAIGGFIASCCHHKNKNVFFQFTKKENGGFWNCLRKKGPFSSLRENFSRDSKIVFAIAFLGILATILGVFVAVGIPKFWLKLYIGILVLSMGIILISKANFNFSWKRIFGVGVLAAFNKGLSGGGFGPVTTGGQIIAGNSHRKSIGCTTLSEVPICLVGFLAYFFMNGFAGWTLLLALSIGAIVGAPLGVLLTKKIPNNKMGWVLGFVILILGAWTLVKLII